MADTAFRLRYVPDATQRSLLVRALWFVFVGWWLSFVWANAATFLALTVVGLPVAFWMFDRLPFVTSLYRFHGQDEVVSGQRFLREETRR